ncbi:hypothetical protein [Rhizobium leguminosarum]|uniref:hypothetical protein n=1 Tax=Rhizobium leguminosarum TaxID=384 RepID=UPI001FDF2C48|nr:hypothetical protein [Rhizobium leguminosarum]
MVHGSDDQIVPPEISAKLTAGSFQMPTNSLSTKVAPIGLLHFDKNRLNADLLALLRA